MNKKRAVRQRRRNTTSTFAPAIVIPQTVNLTFTSTVTTASITPPQIGTASDARLTSCKLQYVASDVAVPTSFIFQLLNNSSDVQVETMRMIAAVGFPKTITLRMPKYVDRGSIPRLTITCTGAGLVTGYVNFSYRGTSNLSTTTLESVSGESTRL